MHELLKKIKAQSEMCTTTEGEEFDCIAIDKLQQVFGEEVVVMSESVADEIEAETEYLDNEQEEEIECI